MFSSTVLTVATALVFRGNYHLYRVSIYTLVFVFIEKWVGRVINGKKDDYLSILDVNGIILFTG